MGEQLQQYGGGGHEDDSTEDVNVGGQERREQLAQETDDLLDEMDGVLEENAEEFIKAYKQKGGQ